MNPNPKQNTSKAATWAAWILTALIMLAVVPSAVMKLTLNPMAVEGFTQMNVPQSAIVPLGVVELLCLVIFLAPRTVVLGMLLLTGYLGGATLANIIGGTDFIHALVIGLLVWVAACLRVPELRALIPIRKTPA
jgi:hypothetical protein